MTVGLRAVDTTEWRSLRSGFLRSAATAPSAPALTVGDVTRSYGDLERTARTWAGAIVAALERRAARVGVFAYRSEVAYAGVLAALMSGATFVPLNRTFPVERTRAMLQAADLDALIVDRASLPQLDAVLGEHDAPLVILTPEDDVVGCSDRIVTRAMLAKSAPLDALPPVVGDEIAYLLFTSGSTGQPKGVPVTHANVRHFIDVMVTHYDVGPGDRLSQTFDQTFDLSVFDLFVAWERGASVCVPQPIELLAPSRFVARHGVTVWFSVPSVAALMLKKNLLRPGIFPSLRLSLFCGEPLPRAITEAWAAAAPKSVLENLYGPTELTIACFRHRWDPATSPDLCVNDVVPIGRPYEGLGAVVVDEDLKPVGPGEPGELCVCGPQTVPGYWRDPARTAERFVTMPALGRSDGVRFYRTGDRVRRLPGGDYVYLGRVDHQIKVLGHRVEPGEIEAVMRRVPGVVDAVALGWPVDGGSAQGVVAFVSGPGADPAAVKEHARRVLPDYMVPREIVVAEDMPLNPNGKIDRKALTARLAARSGAA